MHAVSAWHAHSQALRLSAIVLQSRWPHRDLGLCVTGAWKLEMVGFLGWGSALAGLWIKSIETGSIKRVASHTGVWLATEREERPWAWQVSGGPPLQTAHLGELPFTLIPSVTLTVSTCLAHSGVCTSLLVTCSQTHVCPYTPRACHCSLLSMPVSGQRSSLKRVVCCLTVCANSL